MPSLLLRNSFGILELNIYDFDKQFFMQNVRVVLAVLPFIYTIHKESF